jgi:hypothetical protein
VVRVDQYNFVILVDTVLVNPVRVQHTQISTSSTNSLFGNAPKPSLRFEMVDTLVHRFAICSTFGNMLFAVTPPDTNAVDNIALLGLVTQSTSLVGTGRA